MSLGPKRCPICRWTLAASAKDGCVIGNCSYRSDDPMDMDRRRANRARLERVDAAMCDAEHGVNAYAESLWNRQQRWRVLATIAMEAMEGT